MIATFSGPCLENTSPIEDFRYQKLRLAADEDDEYDGNGGRHDPRFDYSPKAFDKIPWKSIALALFLLFLGCGLLLLSFFIFTGHMGGDRSQVYGLLGLGILTFLPGTLFVKNLSLVGAS
ncbi:hypothetical protein RJ639_018842 [Escallonia herrerae]|uniref:Transmembrane protein 230 n=1 Tax=Escallonia herrerae TaxID=1293975 RepID=A0AA89AI44_9ASTE|nr:hypothetical protein RJ639_018842 [Escallonia herrerae]